MASDPHGAMTPIAHEYGSVPRPRQLKSFIRYELNRRIEWLI